MTLFTVVLKTLSRDIKAKLSQKEPSSLLGCFSMAKGGRRRSPTQLGKGAGSSVGTQSMIKEPRSHPKG